MVRARPTVTHFGAISACALIEIVKGWGELFYLKSTLHVVVASQKALRTKKAPTVLLAIVANVN